MPEHELDQVESAVRALLDDLVADDPVLGTALGLAGAPGACPPGPRRRGSGAVSCCTSTSGASRRCCGGRQRRGGRRVRGAAGRPSLAPRARSCAGAQRHPARSRGRRRRVPAAVRELGRRASASRRWRAGWRASPALLAEARAALEPGLSTAARGERRRLRRGTPRPRRSDGARLRRRVGHDGALDEASAAAVRRLAAFRDHLRRDVLAPDRLGECAAGARPCSRTSCAGSTSWTTRPRSSPPTAARCWRDPGGHGAHRARRRATPTPPPRSPPRRRSRARRRIVDEYRRAVDAARAYVVEHDIVGAARGRGARGRRHTRLPARLLPFAAYDAPGPFAGAQLGFYYVTPPPRRTSARSRGGALREPLRSPRCRRRACTRRTRVTTCSS